ncbi:MAG: IS200/IS605 family transposase [Muribaculaceae bacterium]|nr:IS200/IS605 family transposase [Muribaculaceae bacterium]
MLVYMLSLHYLCDMSYTSILYHIVFRTKHSIQAIDIQHERELYAYILGYVRNTNSKLIRLGGMPDHIHMLVDIHPSIAVANFVRDLKRETSKWLTANQHFPLFQGWGDGYAALTYSAKDKDMIVNYIKNQKEHHKIVSFADEFRNWLQESGIELPYPNHLLD